MSIEGLMVRAEGNALRIAFDRPERLNSLTTEILHAAADQIEAASGAGIRVVLLTGSGRSFSSGADVGADGRPPDVTTIDAANRLVTAIVGTDAVVLSAVNGIAAGVGCSIALAADLAIAKESAAFMLAFTKIGLMPDGGASLLVSAAVGRARAMRMALLAEKVPASTALDWGLISAVVPDAEFDAEVDRLVGLLAGGAPLALAATKKVINQVSVELLQSSLDAERAGQRRLLASADFVEGMAAFQEKRTADFRGE